MEQVGMILIISYIWHNPNPALRQWEPVKRCSGGLETFERRFKTSGNGKVGEAVGCGVAAANKLPGWFLWKGMFWGGQGQGQAFQTEWASDCSLTRYLLFCFFKLRRKCSHVVIYSSVGVQPPVGLRKLWSATAEKQDVFRKVSPHQKARRWGVPSNF